MFKFELNQLVGIDVSGEIGHIKGCAKYASHINAYQVHYKTADGRAEEKWFDETDLSAVEDDAYPGSPVFVVRQEDLPKDAVIE
ncbi:hypothetical protein [Yersinia frederiksenii]|uniref:hypothetical protein n=1 Tax=Yersinia frederiksenii TaxID=29484 RepID=UPI0011A8D107|nr:hypothetical protein [Yersinia frederiksenii]